MARKIIWLLSAFFFLLGGQAFAFIVGDYVVWNNHTYVLLTPGTNDSKDWQSALTAAQTLGAGWDLASITSYDEQVLINSILPTVANRSQVWVGGYQDPVTSLPALNWKWSNGDTPTSFVN
jgi:hypothetical protein